MLKQSGARQPANLLAKAYSLFILKEAIYIKLLTILDQPNHRYYKKELSYYQWINKLSYGFHGFKFELPIWLMPLPQLAPGPGISSLLQWGPIWRFILKRLNLGLYRERQICDFTIDIWTLENKLGIFTPLNTLLGNIFLIKHHLHSLRTTRTNKDPI
jgi:hypothetical protein